MVKMGSLGDYALERDRSDEVKRHERWLQALELGAKVKDVAEAAGVSRQTVWAKTKAIKERRDQDKPKRRTPPERLPWKLLPENTVRVVAKCAGHGGDIRSSRDLICCLECGQSSRDHWESLQPRPSLPRQASPPTTTTPKTRKQKRAEKHQR